MSRYVDLDGLSWDGKPIYSKIQMVKTERGSYMSAITTGWLYCDDVPHIDLEEHDAEVRRQALKEVESAMYNEAFNIDHEVDGMQKWDSGNWIRYKLFEKVMEQLKGETE